MARPLQFRPHHFLCSLGFLGAGYSEEFTANMTDIVIHRLRAEGGDDVSIEVIGATDDICGPCPKRRGALCTNQENIAALDLSHSKALGVRPGDKLTWGQAKARIKSLVKPGDLSKVCAGCQWLEYGYCEESLQALHDGKPS